ncbi:single-stranded DNA-binding protein [Mycobacterium neglectum]|uniref:single-stranded DNA-binding protein n=1 Tax=Mycobacterium neglectum TaxID=242737 RepID=UPI000BFEF36A|nr:single-stranded DNA-binding protein [Mycobacterium neglectum]
MFETPFHIVGNIVTDPIHRQVGEQEMVRFRIASNSRRRSAEGTWEPGNSLFVTVTCWGRAVAGASAGLVKGDPVIVVGHIYTSEYEDRDGNRRSSVEVRATAVGPDLARCNARIDRGKQRADEQAADLGDDAARASDDDRADESSEALPLTA